MRLDSIPLLDRLAPCQRVMLMGAGGGFDVMAGVPLFESLRAQGKEVFYGSLSFSELPKDRNYTVVRADTPGESDYFPERYLSQWYATRGIDVPVYSFKPQGAIPTLSIYRDLLELLGFEALVLVDGGTDSLVRGDEPGLGTPAEDMVSLAAADRLELPVKLLVNLGFGVDTFHGVCHALILEAVAELTATGGFLGAFSLLPGMPELKALSDSIAFIHERMRGRESIVHSSVLAASEGRFGNHHSLPQTSQSELFINPLMSMYWGFELTAVCRRNLFLGYIYETYSRWDVHRAISNFLYTVKPREWMQIPL